MRRVLLDFYSNPWKNSKQIFVIVKKFIWFIEKIDKILTAVKKHENVNLGDKSSNFIAVINKQWTLFIEEKSRFMTRNIKNQLKLKEST